MNMLLVGLCISVIGIAVTALAFAASTRPNSPAATVAPQLPVAKAAAASARFFSDRVPPPILPQPQVPIELLLQQIENHLRLELTRGSTSMAAIALFGN